jgi:transcriptional regulator with AAA-type ATPase domain/transcriptional regulatory protein LevR
MDSLKELISNSILDENPKQPLTDNELASKLGVSRGNVTLVRKSMGIPDSRERRRPYLQEAVKKLKQQGLSARAIATKLSENGFNVSRFIVNIVVEGLDLASQNQRESSINDSLDQKSKNNKENASGKKEPFSCVIGYDGSLAPQVQLAKAAVLYPPKGLHTLIVGPSGTGKNELAESMFRFATTVHNKKIPFIHFNCADYSDNPQLILSQLFGHAKGTFTGADSKKDGLIVKADGGFLFLDEVHRLPAEGQEILFQLIDSGRFRRLGETDSCHQAEVTIIAATTENPESSLLLTFRRRIPMVIEMPPLAARSLEERLALIRQFFRNEASRTETVFRVRQEAIKALLLYECIGNVGQLKSDIQMASAKSFLIYLSEDADKVEVDVVHLSEMVRRGLLKIAGNRVEVDKVLSGDWIIYPRRDVEIIEKADAYTLPGEIYPFMEKRYRQLKKATLSETEIGRIIGEELDRELCHHIKQWDMHKETTTREDLVRIVGEKLVGAVEKAVSYARQRIPMLNDSILQCLALHFNVAFDRLRDGKPIKNPYLDRVKIEYFPEWEIGVEVAEILEAEMNVPIPEDEIGFLAMYLRGAVMHPPDQNESSVGILVMMHGRGIASGMVEVAARLLGLDGAAWLEMSLDEEPDAALERAVGAVEGVNQGKGVLILADMGSLLTFGESITQRTGIPSRTIGRADTTMVIEALRRAAIASMSLEAIYSSLVYTNQPVIGPKTVLVTCITGKGLACKLAKDLEKRIQGDELAVQFMPCSPIEVQEAVQRIGQEKLIAVVGSVNPMLKGVKFFDACNLARGTVVQNLKELLSATAGKITPQFITLRELVKRDLVFIDVNSTEPRQIIEFLADKLSGEKYVSSDFSHSVLERERLVPTYFGFESAVPHGDVKNVLRPALAVARMTTPCLWGTERVRFVFLMAATSICSKAIVQLYNQMADASIRQQLIEAETAEEFARILSDYSS